MAGGCILVPKQSGKQVSDFLQTIIETFSSLIGHGQLAVESSHYDADAFGNAVVVLAGGNLRIRMIRDRDETWADAASRLDPAHWYPLQRAIRAAGGSPPPPEGLLTPAGAADLVARHLDALNSAFAPDAWDETRRNLGKLKEESFRNMKNRLERKD